MYALPCCPGLGMLFCPVYAGPVLYQIGSSACPEALSSPCTDRHVLRYTFSLQYSGKRNATPVGVIQEDQLEDGWSPVIFDYDWVASPKALRAYSRYNTSGNTLSSLTLPCCSVTTVQLYGPGALPDRTPTSGSKPNCIIQFCCVKAVAYQSRLDVHTGVHRWSS